MGGVMSAPADGGAPPPKGGHPPSALVVVGPSGVGKGTLIRRLMDGSPEAYGFSVSHTTRAARQGEKDGVHYHFVSREDFEAGVAGGEFLEHATVHGNLYGTTAKAVQAVADSGRCCVLDIDVQGARAVRSSGLRVVFAFVAPPSLAALEARLRGRGTETDAQVAVRLDAAKEELESLNEAGLYDFVILNDDVSVAAAQLAGVARRALDGRVGNGTGDGGPVDAGAPLPPEAGQPVGVAADATAAGTSGAGVEAAAAEGAAAAAALPAGRLTDKVALVTGASSGIGRAVALALVAEGACVAGAARRRDRLEALTADIAAAGLPADRFLPIVCDITKENEVVALPKIMDRRWPGTGVHILVNAAGLARVDSGMLDGSTSAWSEMLATNVLAAAVVARECVTDMRARGNEGHILQISSLMGHRVYTPAPGVGGFYAATKHALRAMTEGLRQEVQAAGLPIRTTLISPGRVATEFFDVVNYGRGAAPPTPAAAPRPLAAADVAEAVLFALTAPPGVDVNDLLLRPLGQPN